MAEFSTGRSAEKAQWFHEQFILPLTLTDFLPQKIIFCFSFQIVDYRGRSSSGNKAKAKALILANTNLIKRPVLDTGSELVFGFKPATFAKALDK